MFSERCFGFCGHLSAITYRVRRRFSYDATGHWTVREIMLGGSAGFGAAARMSRKSYLRSAATWATICDLLTPPRMKGHAFANERLKRLVEFWGSIWILGGNQESCNTDIESSRSR